MEQIIEKAKNTKKMFENYCIENEEWLDTKTLPLIPKNSKKEAVLIEFRTLKHLYFLIRNSIRVLGDEWCHTIICGDDNFNFIENIVNRINRPIKIIKLEKKNVSRLEYSLMLLKSDFYKNLRGDYLLIYQEDTIIFKKIPNDFLNYDFIGAPIPGTKNLFNGGFSIRNRLKMYQICLKYYDPILSRMEKTKQYLEKKEKELIKKNINFKVNKKFIFLYKIEECLLEDILLCKRCTKLPSFEKSLKFSVESYPFNKPIGGHQFWYAIEDIELWLDNNLKN